LEINFSPPVDVYGVNKSIDSEELPKLLKKNDAGKRWPDLLSVSDTRTPGIFG